MTDKWRGCKGEEVQLPAVIVLQHPAYAANDSGSSSQPASHAFHPRASGFPPLAVDIDTDGVKAGACPDHIVYTSAQHPDAAAAPAECWNGN